MKLFDYSGFTQDRSGRELFQSGMKTRKIGKTNIKKLNKFNRSNIEKTGLRAIAIDVRL